MHACSGACVANNSTDHCGLSCDKCLAPAGGTATCDGTQCAFDCGTLKKCNSKCVAGCCIDADCAPQDGKTGQCDTSSNTCSYLNCATGFKPCGTLCIGADKCCAPNDCTGVCMTCSGPGGTCVSVKGQDDSDSCTGTCDATGACRSKRGQSCQTTAGGCMSGTVCAPDGICCDRACTNSCEACDISGFAGTCTLVAAGPPHGNRTSCGTDATCKGQCAGRTDALCSYPGGSCGAGSSCSGVNVIDSGTCSTGACITSAAHPCVGGFVCSGSACEISCSTDADCLPDYFCHAGLCHRDAKAVAVSYDHACVLLVDGTVRCWGTLVPAPASSTPVVVPGLSGVTKISIAQDYDLALLSDGTVRQWGSVTTAAQTISIVTNPTVIPNINTAVGISAGSTVNCAILANKLAQCWGYNTLGALGNGNSTTIFSANPVTVANLMSVTAVSSSGDFFSCAIEGGGVQCWGRNDIGQLGNQTSGNSSLPVIAVFPGLPTTAIAVSVSHGGDHACAIQSTGAVFCWGSNGTGQLGDGTMTSRASPVMVGGVSGGSALALGDNHTCVLLNDGTVKCWGLNMFGELGNGLTMDSPTPQTVSLGGKAIAIEAGANSSCAVLSSGAVVCWGHGTGFGSPIDAPTPVPTPDW